MAGAQILLANACYCFYELGKKGGGHGGMEGEENPPGVKKKRAVVGWGICMGEWEEKTAERGGE
ncbi:unnamed protein product [Prunus armeniaca]